MGEYSRPISTQTQRSRFNSRQSRRTDFSEDQIELYKNIIRDRRQRQILLLCTDLTDKQKSKHVVDSAVALRNQGHKVTMITTAYDERIYSENVTKIGIIECGKWIPTSIKGHFFKLFHFFRSLYSTMYMVCAFRKLQPKVSVVFCETNCLMIPLIKFLTEYKIVYFQYQFDLATHRRPASEIKFNWTWFKNRCLRQADQILVPNKVFYDVYVRNFKDVFPTICEPYLNVRTLRKEKLLPLTHVLEDVNNETLIFLVLAEYHPRSNLELALDAFHLLLHTIEHAAHSRLKLVVAGHAGRGRMVYVRRLGARVRRLHLDNRVLLNPRPSRQQKKSLLSGCIALLSCQKHGLWDRYVLEAMALGRPVIGVDTGFTKEVLENEVTGYIGPATPEYFSAAMSEIIYNMAKGEFIGKMAHCDFIKKYSLEAYGARLNKIIHNFYSPGNKVYNEINLANNNELFFG